MLEKRIVRAWVVAIVLPIGILACDNATSESAEGDEVQSASCLLVEEGYGPEGRVRVRAEVVASGLEVPWGIAFLPNGDILVTERPGRLRLVRDGELVEKPVAEIEAQVSGEGGLLGIALHPQFSENRRFYLYYTASKGGEGVNRIEQWTLAEDYSSASPVQIILDDIPAARYHNGGRIRFGPDCMLYVGTGDAGRSSRSQENRLAGKILRITPEGQAPPDNPWPGSRNFITGIRNTQAFDWLNDSLLYVADHGPSGERGRQGHDEVSIASAGDNLGWPDIYGCEESEGMVTPILTWSNAAPPGGAAVYTGDLIPEWKGSLLVGTLRSEHLHRVVYDPQQGKLVEHEVYFDGNAGYGRLRDVVMGPDGALYVTTSNCDGRGSCPTDGDKILRIVPAAP